jgi:hypothetical protein
MSNQYTFAPGVNVLLAIANDSLSSRFLNGESHVSEHAPTDSGFGLYRHFPIPQVSVNPNGLVNVGIPI